jgi:branched-chain amino acid transport system permease protein
LGWERLRLDEQEALMRGKLSAEEVATLIRARRILKEKRLPKDMDVKGICEAAGIGALAGCVVSPITYVQYDSGTGLAIKGFTVAILGGLGNSTAAIAAGLILGILESFSVWVMPTAFKDVVSISILLLILFVRPSGIFGSVEASRLKEF